MDKIVMIVYEVGFGNVIFFNVVFKKEMGIIFFVYWRNVNF